MSETKAKVEGKVESKDELEYYTYGEELANTISHGIGALLAILGLIILLISLEPHEGKKFATFLVYGICLFLGYAASAIYHGIVDKKWKKIFRSVDHGCIFLLIAGTYTPFMTIIIGGTIGLAILIAVWIMALVGILMLFPKKDLPQYASTVPYLVMGWLALFAINPIYDYSVSNGWGMFAFLLIGGLFYSSGTYFYKRDEMPYNHLIWHLFVLAGSISHYIAVYKYVVPFP